MNFLDTDCAALDRRRFLASLTAAAIGGTALRAAPSPKSVAETAVKSDDESALGSGGPGKA